MPDSAGGEPVAGDPVRRPVPAGGRARPQTTLARRLGLLVAAVALPLLALATWSVWESQASFRDQAERALLERLQTIAAAVEREFDRAEVVLQSLAASSAMARGDLAAVEHDMRAVSVAFDGLPVVLVGPDGNILLATLWPPGERRAGIPAPPEARELIATGRSGVTNLFRAPLTGILTISVGVPLGAVPQAAPAARAVAAGVGLSFPRDRIGGLLRAAAGLADADAPEGWTASIIDRRGVSVARTAGESGIVGGPARPEVFARIAAIERGVLHGLTTRDGQPAITAVMRGPRSGYTYVLTMPRSAFAAPLRAALTRTLAIGGVVLALGLGLATLAARRIVAAFRTARRAARGGGLVASTGLREADELAEALAGMAAGRDRAEAALATSERRNREMLESLGERLYSLDPEGRVRFASRAALQSWGVAPEAALGRRFPERFPVIVGKQPWLTLHAALQSRQEVHLCAVSPLTSRWVEVDAYPSSDGGLTVAFRDVDDLRTAHRERARVTEELRASEERLRMALDAAELGAWEVDLREAVIRRSARALEIFGLGPEAEVEPYPAWRERIHPEDRAAALDLIQRVIEGRAGSYRVEYRYPRADGRWIWIESHGRVVTRDASGAALRIAGTSRDVTARRMAEERQALLAREVDHRAKNALAVVQAAVRLTPKDDAQAFARAIEGRLGALARAHTLLAADRWAAADLRTMLTGELAPFLAPEGAGPQVRLDGPKVALPAGAAQPLAMALHELATNAVKHGARSRPAGSVAVAWELVPGAPAEPPTLRITWAETGGPPVSGTPSRRGFGSRVLEGTLRGQLGGAVTLDWLPGGLVCRMEVPLRRGTVPEVAAAFS